ncbi:MAG: hypothetical protein AAB839_00690 [Patescibacteria group bacterium]
MATPILFMFGGVSAEHEVSVVTGLQALEHVDRHAFAPYCVYITKTGEWLGYGDLEKRADFQTKKPRAVSIGKDRDGGFITEEGIFGATIRPKVAFLAFHGGTGESGPLQGLLEAFDIPFTSTGQEGAVITMNKALGKEVLAAHGLPIVHGISIRREDIVTDSAGTIQTVQRAVPLPAIIKPAHLGSSIGIHIARTNIELEKYLLESAQLDTEIVIETFLPSFKEYNCAVRLVNGVVEASAIESPVAKDAILSFADKYQRGGKKSGGDGMASLQRELPANISEELKATIEETAKAAFVACRCKGMVRIDFMVTPDGKTYITEINPIPGSMAFYLWEAKGIPFQQQITDLLNQAIIDQRTRSSLRMDYQSDIIQKFIG